MRCYFTLLVVFSLSGLGLAAPGGEGDNVGKGNALGKGDIVWVRPKDLTPKDPEQAGINKKGRHPAVLVSDVNNKNQVKVALVSHTHRRGTPVLPANDYIPFGIHPVKGKSFINVGPPQNIPIEKVTPAKFDPKHVEPHKLQNLIKDINRNCLPHQQLEDISIPPYQQLAGPSRTKSRDSRSRESRQRDAKSRESDSRNYESQASKSREDKPRDSKSRDSKSRASASRDYRSRESRAKDSRSRQSSPDHENPKLKRKASDITPPEKLSAGHSGSRQRSPARAKKRGHYH